MSMDLSIECPNCGAYEHVADDSVYAEHFSLNGEYIEMLCDDCIKAGKQVSR